MDFRIPQNECFYSSLRNRHIPVRWRGSETFFQGCLVEVSRREIQRNTIGSLWNSCLSIGPNLLSTICLGGSKKTDYCQRRSRRCNIVNSSNNCPSDHRPIYRLCCLNKKGLSAIYKDKYVSPKICRPILFCNSLIM